MDAEKAAQLRKPFQDDAIGKLPRVTCPACSKKNCQDHKRVKCGTCGNYISTQHIHLDYVGHAAITDRLLAVDPDWSWEPVAFDAAGLPARDQMGGLWIRLTVCGVTRLGYGDAEGKNGPAAVKEAIGDALRNGAMRFGVGLDLWHKDGQLVHDDAPPVEQAPQTGRKQSGQQRSGASTADDSRQIGDEGWAGIAAAQARRNLAATCKDNGWDAAVVAAKYAEKAGHPLGEATDAARVGKFREWLFTLPQADLMPAAAAAAASNGASS